MECMYYKGRPRCGIKAPGRLWRPFPASLKIVAVIVISLLFLLWPNGAEARVSLQWSDVARLNPKLKVLLNIKSQKPFTITDLAMLADRKLIPADRDPGLVVGLKEMVFTTRISHWIQGPPLPQGFSARLLNRFIMSGVYRVNFKVRQSGYRGPLRLEVTAPREGFGRKLLESDYVVRPEGKAELKTDNSGNRWVFVNYERAPVEKTIRFHFQFKYLVDMADLLAHDLMIFGGMPKGQMPDQIKPYLGVGYKIDPTMQTAVNWAASGKGDPPNAKKEYERLTRFLKRNVVYDKRKRAEYFGGKSVYRDIDDMYQPPDFTLSKQAGCCPDTILIECAFMRARGIPCRTVGRFGHFFSEMYVPGRGWMSTSVTPTGIPLVVSYGPDHLPYQNWKPKLRMQTSAWEARMRIEALGDNDEPAEMKSLQAKSQESFPKPDSTGSVVDKLDPIFSGSSPSIKVEEDTPDPGPGEPGRWADESKAPVAPKRSATTGPPKEQMKRGFFELLP